MKNEPMTSTTMTSDIEFFKLEDRIWDTVVKTFNTTKQRIDEDVILLQEWLKTQPHLPQMLDFQSVRNFLILNKCSVEVAKQKIDSYYTVRSQFTEVYDRINPKYPYHKELNEILYFVPYPQLTEEMYRICYFKVKNESLMHIYDPVDLVKRIITIQEMRLREDVMFAEVCVADCRGVTLDPILKTTPTRLYNWLIRIYEKVFSLRVKAVYLLNMPTIFTIILTMAQRLLKPKMFERIHICKNVEEVQRAIPLKLLPEDFGGEGLSLDVLQEALEAKYREQDDLFNRLDKMKVNESLRPEELKNTRLVTYGNFKQLDID